ncbi:SPW repeat protein [Halorubrum sp. JWXQ-INN 858]|uniref:SPW repeat protein n=1 Tax=Halorubrum sp. JWXQ-INN 858 TaxID=2690782 RepID=UPI00190F774F|nr:SPW repeat protein [Halorubrum sp. JWXQ-INN 858]
MDTERRGERGDSEAARRGERGDSEAARRGERGDSEAARRDEPDDHGANPSERGKWLSALIALLGLWMIAQAIGLDLTQAQFWNDVLVGSLLIGVGGYNYSRQANERFANTAVALIAVAAGLWLIAAPFVLGTDTGIAETTNETWFYNHIAVGLLTVGLGAYSAYQAGDRQQDTRRAKT